MSVIGGQNNTLISQGLIYALDFKNPKTYVSGSTLARSLTADTATTIVSNVDFTPYSNISFDYPWTGYIQRTGSLFDFNPVSSTFTVFLELEVTAETTQNIGSLFIQNTTDYQFAASVTTSSIHVGFYNNQTSEYYVRSFPKPFSTSSQVLTYRYDMGTVDMFLDGTPITSSANYHSILSLVTSSAGNFLEYETLPPSLLIGYGTSAGVIYGVGTIRSYLGNLSKFFVYDRALTFEEIYQNYYYVKNGLSTVVPDLFPYTLDENTLLYVSSSNITDTSSIQGINRFITSLKSESIWNKLSAVYPIYGTDTASYFLNLKEPGVNPLLYTGSFNTSSIGITPSSADAYFYLDYFNYPTLNSTSSLHFSYMSYDTPEVTGSLFSNKKTLRAIGGEIFYSGSKTYHVYRQPDRTSSFQILDPSLVSVETLVVAGGGAGSGFGGGGGGAGGLIYSASYPLVTTSPVDVIVGEGGICRVNGQGNSGSYSIFDTIQAVGGGAGIDMFGGPTGKSNGGSGGGAGREHGGAQSGLSGSGIPGQGNNGGPKAGIGNGNSGAAGGGGASQAGQPGGTQSPSTPAGAGGSGSYFSQYAGLGLGFPAGWFAGGGGGSHGYITNPGPGGPGGGGTGGGVNIFGNPGVKNTGGGGGGGAVNGSKGGYGGSGIVIISYDTIGPGTQVTSSTELTINNNEIIGNIQSEDSPSLSFSGPIGLVSVSRTGSTFLSIHRNITSSIFLAPVTSSNLPIIYVNSTFDQGAITNTAPYSISYLSYGEGLSPSKINTYHNIVGRLQYDLGRGGLIEGFPAAAAYSVRQLSKMSQYSMEVRRDWDNASSSIGFTSNGDLDTGSLLSFVKEYSQSFTVTVEDDGGGNVFVLDGTQKPPLTLFRGGVYTFDQSNATNTTHPIAFKSGSESYTTGVVSTGTPGEAGAQTVFTVANDAPDDLSYYCTEHGDYMGNTITVTENTGSGFVKTWYDQSGNNKHAIQTTNAKQPLIINSGSVFLENQKPAIHFTGNNVATQTGFSAGTITSTPSDYSIYYVKNAKGGQNPWLIMFGNGSYLTQTYPGNATTYYLQDGAGRSMVGTSATPRTQHVGEIYLNSSNNLDSRAYENNALQKQGFTAGTYSKVAIPNLLISIDSFQAYTGSAQEIIISTTNHLPSRSSIVSNINSYFNIY
jgi:hypothetical protein